MFYEGGANITMSCVLLSAASFSFLTKVSYQYFEKRCAVSACNSVNDVRSYVITRTVELTFSLVNFVHALISTLCSSFVLFAMRGYKWTDLTMGRENPLMAWTVELVCGYLLVELPFLALAKRRLPSSVYEEFLEGYDEMMVFHGVALFGLLSVLLLDRGFVIGLWVIWTELTSVFLGLETFFEVRGYNISMKNAYAVLAVITTLAFVLQRCFLFIYLLLLCWTQFHWHATFVVQFVILIVGSVLNGVFSAQRCYWTVAWLWSTYAVRHK
ncbi:uncharacterized protein LOC134186933 [Corticium candelabrum]|uniref:uncharacterized protein LOC134186933 n=1 Tax=Corticium candelabrum TaxID=121492 RepID=UPI002E26D62C|nr:uncharacterized protein LOC134186933 [Corticium candelabrum]